MTQRTPLFTIMQTFVRDECGKLRREKVLTWMFFHKSRFFRVEDFYKRPIKYQGISFEVLPRQDFWNGYIEPFLKDISCRAIDRALKLCQQQNVAVHSAIQETCHLLKSMVRDIYEEMANVDLMLREEINSTDLTQKEVGGYIAFMNLVIDDMADSALSKLK